MAKIKGKNTGPERAVRSLLHRAGRRFRIHVRALPGTPDIVLPGSRVVVFIHGCFWHRHAGCKGASTPKTRFTTAARTVLYAPPEAAAAAPRLLLHAAALAFPHPEAGERVAFERAPHF